ncbi:DUF771 domain-containing protein [Staphylococcus pseudintermedius]|uniref:DUF771 domain-containing protein n=1 Tax=Staphylococcus intermedius group TaxID=2815305 RepID=UPI000BBC2096|nr:MULTISPECIES: DUF771 domain-containing protein [Staphylococcus intermedius group]EGQ1294006.1 DUF771 domain-containing protein [Staphylococcus pseudintermedius]EGQ3118616.1 DUF771 domain-containing protein [Staphylococcus pseudintermedius]EGQ3654871.1 DUF771 domain-containing protein [Staphylococcus pseudintermedius]EGQ3947569.1 DUF771 domain-containing protein [Staphylococcus pseudintermedius]EGQ4421644.1 DUF771 domain-containing protein [Staphylococcus pseudintermedius]
MVQTLQLNVTIPDGFVLIERDKIRELEDLAIDPVWDLKDLKQKLKMSSDDTIKNKFLHNPRFEKQLKKLGIAHYPDDNFNRWRFNARKMSRFIDENFAEIINSKGGG